MRRARADTVKTYNGNSRPHTMMVLSPKYHEENAQDADTGASRPRAMTEMHQV